MAENLLNDWLKRHPDWEPFVSEILFPPTAREILEKLPDADLDVVRRGDEQILYDGVPLTRGALYVKMRACGEKERFAAACACQRYPAPMSDDVFWGGRPHFADVYGEGYFNRVKAALAAKGVNLTSQDEYMPELAQGFADPEAVINRTQGRGYIKKLLESRGSECHGAVELEAREPESDPLSKKNCVGLAPDLVRENLERIRKKNPEATKNMDSREVRESVTDAHGLPG